MVSRVAHGQDRVSPSTRRRVLKVIEALGYVPDGAAQSLAQRRKEVIGLVAVESRGPETDVEREGFLFIEEVLRGVERAGRSRLVSADLLPACGRSGGRVVGFDDMHLSALLAPPLTTIRQPMRLLGERACSRLLQRIADPALPPRAELLPTELIIRESCGCDPNPAPAPGQN